MGDRPTKLELLEAVKGFLERELLPTLDGVRRFHTLVSANALGIVAREIALEGEQLRARHARLAHLLERDDVPPADPAELATAVEELERALCERIRAGIADAGPGRAAVLAHLWTTTRERLAVSNPAYR